MTKRFPLPVAAPPLAALLLAISALLGACASGGPASEYSYLLPAAGEPAASSRLPRVEVDLAGYLDQAGVVVETAPTSVHAARRHLWAEPLPSQLRRALRHHLAAAGMPAGGRLTVSVTRFQGTADGDARISGQWHYLGDQRGQEKGGEKSGRFDVTRPLNQDGYPELVTRLDAAWQAVAEQIATELRTP